MQEQTQSEVVQNNKYIRIMIVDDHPLMRQALKNLLESQKDFKIIKEAGDGEAAVKLAAELNPDIIVMDIAMPKMNGLEATRAIKSQNPEIKILVLTVHTDNAHLIEILGAGADGYLTKSVFGEEVNQAIRTLTAGGAALSAEILKNLLKHVIKYPIKTEYVGFGEKLSVREMEILKLTAKGMDNIDIAKCLNISIRTVKSHLMEIFSKLKASSRTEAVIIALRSGLITISDLD